MEKGLRGRGMRLESEEQLGGGLVAERRKEGGGNDFKGGVQNSGEAGLLGAG